MPVDCKPIAQPFATKKLRQACHLCCYGHDPNTWLFICLCSTITLLCNISARDYFDEEMGHEQILQNALLNGGRRERLHDISDTTDSLRGVRGSIKQRQPLLFSGCKGVSRNGARIKHGAHCDRPGPVTYVNAVISTPSAQSVLPKK
ncbi:hypothetical protein J6590_084160 [Homalodisca vitripennis]|nr:hypothetical protein J6590_084160 [Homalodisca vitripennis]